MPHVVAGRSTPSRNRVPAPAALARALAPATPPRTRIVLVLATLILLLAPARAALAQTATIDWENLTPEQYDALTPEQLEEFRAYKKSDAAIVSYLIWEDSDDAWHDAADHAQGDEFGYRLTASIPNRYTWKWWDLTPYKLVALPENTLAYIPGSVVVTCLHKDGTSEDVTAGFQIDASDERIEAYASDLRAAVPGFTATDQIRLSYRMRFKDNCHRGLARGNQSFGHVEYSVWSSYAEDADASESDQTIDTEDSVTAQTVSLASSPELCVIAYTYDLDVLKISASDNKPLPGASFKLHDTKANTWYVLENGWSQNEAEATVATTADDGHALFTCVDSDQYELVEVEAPAGYGTVDPIDVRITCDVATGGSTLSVASAAAKTEALDSRMGRVLITVEDPLLDDPSPGPSPSPDQPESGSGLSTLIPKLLRTPSTGDPTTWVLPTVLLLASLLLLALARRQRQRSTSGM